MIQNDSCDTVLYAYDWIEIRWVCKWASRIWARADGHSRTLLFKETHLTRSNRLPGWETRSEISTAPFCFGLIDGVHLLPQPTAREGKTMISIAVKFCSVLSVCDPCVYLSMTTGVGAVSASSLSSSSPISHFWASSTESAATQTAQVVAADGTVSSAGVWMI